MKNQITECTEQNHRSLIQSNKQRDHKYTIFFRQYPLSVNVWDHHRAPFLEKNPKSSLVTSQLGLEKWKLYVLIECQLGYPMILISNGICQNEGKYAALNKNICHFLGPSPTALSRKNSKAQEHIQIDAMLRSGFFRNTRSVPRFGFFQDAGIRVK